MTSSLRPLSALLLALLAPHLAAQTPAPVPASGGSLVFQGDTTRAGIGWDSDNDWRGELFHVFREDAGSAWLGELWATSESAGGAKLSYHWRPADAAADAGVRKLFGAIDQNRDHDRKVTLGGGYETERFFASGYLSAGVTGRRETGFSSTSTTQTITGVEPGGRPYEQDITTTVTTRTSSAPTTGAWAAASVTSIPARCCASRRASTTSGGAAARARRRCRSAPRSSSPERRTASRSVARSTASTAASRPTATTHAPG